MAQKRIILEQHVRIEEGMRKSGDLNAVLLPAAALGPLPPPPPPPPLARLCIYIGDSKGLLPVHFQSSSNVQGERSSHVQQKHFKIGLT